MLSPQALRASALLACLVVVACSGKTMEDREPEGTGGSPGAETSDCDPLEDTCPEGMYCQVEGGRTACVEEGTTERDELCEDSGSCQRDSICLSAGEFSGKRCQQPCPLDEDPWAVCDIGRHTCFVGLDDDDRELPFGVCRY